MECHNPNCNGKCILEIDTQKTFWIKNEKGEFHLPTLYDIIVINKMQKLARRSFSEDGTDDEI